jgi:hypothetical protein
VDFRLNNHSLAPSANSLGIDTAVLVSVIVSWYEVGKIITVGETAVNQWLIVGWPDFLLMGK